MSAAMLVSVWEGYLAGRTHVLRFESDCKLVKRRKVEVLGKNISKFKITKVCKAESADW